ncbi:hypothetical protein SLE2022_375910 [Rubroshorea leprosula]
MSDNFCSDCKRLTEVVFDHAAGDTICSECGLVPEAHSVDETSEWRTFANESSDNDPVRVGGLINPLLTNGGISTVIVRPNGASGDFLSSSLGKWQGRGANPDRNLIQAFKSIAAMCERLGLPAIIKLMCLMFIATIVLYSSSPIICKSSTSLEVIFLSLVTLFRVLFSLANEIYKRVEDQKPLKGRNQEAIFGACLYIACRQENKPRTVKEICSVVNGTTKKEIGHAKEFIVKHLEVEMGHSVEMGTIHAGDYMRRFCSSLGMTNQEVKAAQEAVQKSEELDIRRSPISIAAAVIYIISQLSVSKKPLKDISIATRVAEGTIKNSFKDLYPHLSRIIPSWFATEEDIKNIF